MVRLHRAANILLIVCVHIALCGQGDSSKVQVGNLGTTGGQFVPMKIGGGGFVTGGQIAPDGTQFIRTDTAGAWIRSGYTQNWSQAVSVSAMPSPDNALGTLEGVCEVAIAPSNPNHLYMFYAPNRAEPIPTAYIYSSINKGQTWIRTDTSFKDTCAPNDQNSPSYRLNSPYMRVDPANENVVYVGTPSHGVYYTTTGGIGAGAWHLIPTSIIPGGSTPSGADEGQGNLIQFDAGGETSGGKTNKIYISSYGNGIWESTNAGGTWAELNSTGMPTTFSKLRVDQNGTLWVVDNAGGGNGGDLLRYLSGKWSTEIRSNAISAVAINPSASGNIYAADYRGCLYYTTNGQVGSAIWNRPAGACGRNPPTSYSISSRVIPWMPWADDPVLSIQYLEFDPSQPNALYAFSGIGVFKTTPPTSGTPVVNWDGDETAGIENLDLTYGLGMPGGGLIFTAQDRPIWLPPNNLSSYPSQYFPSAENRGNEIVRGFSPCFYGSTFIGVAVPGLTVSTSSGSPGSWSSYTYAINPNTANGGNCAVISSTSWIDLVSDDGGPYYTSDSGGSYSPCTFNNGATVDGGGWHHAAYDNRQALAGDTVTPSTVLLYNDGTGAKNGLAAAGIYKTTSGCAFTQVYKGVIGGPVGQGGSFLLEAVPGKSCNFFAAILGYVHNPQPEPYRLFKSTTCGATWSSAIPNVKSIFAYGFGAAKSGGDSYPVFYCSCYASTNGGLTYSYNIWESDNIDQASPIWTAIGGSSPFPGGDFDLILFIQGDLKTYGTVYGGFAGSGGFYRTVSPQASPRPDVK
jgi:hypothetical protein